jgi:hypothetical protein
VNTSRTPEEGAHSPSSWPNRLNIIIIIIIVSNTYSPVWQNKLVIISMIILLAASAFTFRCPFQRVV